MKELTKPFMISESKTQILDKLLNSIEDIQVSDKGTLIKFKGHLVTVTDGSNIIQSTDGHIVQIANSIQLNPVLEDVNSVQSINEQVENRLEEVKKEQEEYLLNVKN